jgi:hypothetical protein
MRCHWVVLCLGFAACRRPGTSSPALTLDTLAGGIVRVVNHPAAAAHIGAWQLVLERTIHPPAGSPGELMTPSEVVANDAGDLFVLDEAPAAIHRYNPDGGFVGLIARAGAGPGEIGSGWMYMSRDTLVYQDGGQSRMTSFSLDGHPLRIWRTEAIAETGLLADDSGRVPVQIETDATGGQATVRYRLDSTVADTVRDPAGPESPTWSRKVGHSMMGTRIPFGADQASVFDRSGRLVFGDQSMARLIYSRNGRDTLLVVDLPLPLVPIPDSVRQAAYDDALRHSHWLTGIAHLDDIPTSYARWSAIVPDGNNNVWVLAPGPHGVADHWLVVGPDGRLISHVTAPFDDPDDAYWTRDRVYRIGTDAGGTPAILVYRIDRRGH